MDGDHLFGLLGALAISQAATCNPGLQAVGNWARYIHAPKLKLMTSSPGIQAIGNWAEGT
jgi:hypothetical protein